MFFDGNPYVVKCLSVDGKDYGQTMNKDNVVSTCRREMSTVVGVKRNSCT